MISEPKLQSRRRQSRRRKSHKTSITRTLRLSLLATAPLPVFTFCAAAETNVYKDVALPNGPTRSLAAKLPTSAAAELKASTMRSIGAGGCLLGTRLRPKVLEVDGVIGWDRRAAPGAASGMTPPRPIGRAPWPRRPTASRSRRPPCKGPNGASLSVSGCATGSRGAPPDPTTIRARAPLRRPCLAPQTGGLGAQNGWN